MNERAIAMRILYRTVTAFSFPILAFGAHYLNIDPPGSSGAQASSINNAGQVVGTSDLYSFLRQPNGTYIQIKPPGATGLVIPTKINDNGQITGFFVLAGYSGFIADHGKYTVFNVPGSDLTQSNSINLEGSVAGIYGDLAGLHGFIRDSVGVFTTFDIPGSLGTIATSINDSGQVAGYYLTTNTATRGFIRNIDGSLITFDADPQNRNTTFVYQINGNGQVTGMTLAGLGYDTAFVRDPSGTITLIPGGSSGLAGC